MEGRTSWWPGVCTWLALLPALGHPMVRYTTHCKDPALGDPDRLFCPDERFRISCNGAEVVVGTVCLGAGTDCNHTAGDCLDHYRVSYDLAFRRQLEQCLWTDSLCQADITDYALAQGNQHKCVGHLISGDRYDYVAVFGLHCVSKDIIFDVCGSWANKTIPETGYVHSPGFPARVYGTKDCSLPFYYGERSKVEFWIQRVQLEDEVGDHVTITGLSEDGSPDRALSWTGHDVYSLEVFIINSTYGFMVEYNQIRSLDGFLISYTVSSPPPTVPPKQVPESAPATTSNEARALAHSPVLCLVVCLGVVHRPH